MKCSRCGATKQKLLVWIQISGMSGKDYVCCWSGVIL